MENERKDASGTAAKTNQRQRRPGEEWGETFKEVDQSCGNAGTKAKTGDT